MLAGWGGKLKKNKVSEPSSNLKVSTLQVFSAEECQEELTEDEIEATTKEKLDKGFTSDFSCLGNDFNFAAGL